MKWVIVALAYMALVAGAYVQSSRTPTENAWYDRIQAIGGAAAYAEFAESVATWPLAKQHEAAHLFGDNLYRAVGINGLSVCDIRFSYGCFHEFLGRAIAEHGLTIIDSLNDSCAKKLKSDLACQHGLGHGILASQGYAFSDLQAALAACDTLRSKTPGGCFGGVFMEYNMRSMLVDEAIRPLGDDVCASLPRRYSRACYYTMPQWWLAHRVHLSQAQAYTEVGHLCDALQSDLRRSCFAGIGVEVISDTEGSVSQAIQLCDAAAPDPDKVWCLSLATQAFGGDDKRTVCTPLTGGNVHTCEKYGEDLALVLALQGFEIDE